MADHLPEDEKPRGGDPWHAFGYLLSGVGLYGFGGWALDRWLGTTGFVVVGILLGAGLGLFMTVKRFGMAPSETPKKHT